jgi:hypothetical protein
VLGEHQLELAVQHDGFVRALVFDAQGRRMDDASSATIVVTLTGEDGRKHALELARDARRRCFWGKANAGGALGLSSIPVKLDVGGKVVAGSLSQYALLPAPRFGGQVIAVGGFGVELVATGDRLAAHVLDSWGKAVTRIDLELKLVSGDGSELALTWDAPSSSYRAALDGKLDASTQPLRLALGADGKLHVGATQSLRSIAELRAAAAVPGSHGG